MRWIVPAIALRSLGGSTTCNLFASSQPRDHADIDRVAASDGCQRFAACPALDGLGALIFGQFRLPAKPHTGCHGALPAFTGAFPDQLPFELGDGSEQGGEQPTLRAGCVPQGIAE